MVVCTGVLDTYGLWLYGYMGTAAAGTERERDGDRMGTVLHSVVSCVVGGGKLQTIGERRY